MSLKSKLNRTFIVCDNSKTKANILASIPNTELIQTYSENFSYILIFI